MLEWLTLTVHGLCKFVSNDFARIEYGGLRVELDGFSDAATLKADFK